MVNKSGSTGKAYLLLIIGIIFLAFTAPWVKQSNFDPATSVILRCSIGGLALLPFAIREAKKLGPLNRTGVILSLVAGLFLGIDFTAWNYSIYYVGSGIASILLNLQIIILPALAFLIDKERVPRSFFIIAPIMILGIVLSGGIIGGGGETGGPTTIHGMPIALIGTLEGSLSGICYGIYLYTSRKATKVNRGQFIQPMLWASIAQLVAPAFVMLFLSHRGFDVTHGVMVNGVLPMNPETTLGDPITAMNWFWMFVLAIAGQAMAWTFVQYGSVRLNSTIVAGLLLLSPISTVAIIAVVLFGEIPNFIQVIGIIIVLGAVAYQNGLLSKLKGVKSTGEP
ncbi:DMT family transporter [Sporosarcina pasteurii]|uniref:EamA-like transporter family n=1 Tax=Sporosarcina pasteurii TaxID=1474 RepID=A0A380CG58_SPOPA|nr:DMT family transporter [Sporosarcina pasteurii]MDS9473216.1 DMT family transporter [Sporosarcina pasteurii]QBQ06949.1 DMT family transporter [Sporosarcina pasteurii]SUJ18308.1 EamA-like transporter family [Sporosarcina pasteurii]